MNQHLNFQEGKVAGILSNKQMSPHFLLKYTLVYGLFQIKLLRWQSRKFSGATFYILNIYDSTILWKYRSGLHYRELKPEGLLISTNKAPKCLCSRDFINAHHDWLVRAMELKSYEIISGSAPQNSEQEHTIYYPHTAPFIHLK